jgi:hypothetical protein
MQRGVIAPLSHHRAAYNSHVGVSATQRSVASAVHWQTSGNETADATAQDTRYERE